MKVKNYLKSFACFFLSFFLVAINGLSVSAIVKIPYEEEFSENNIVFYNPDGKNCGSGSSSGGGEGGEGGGGGAATGSYGKLKEIIRQYGEYAMDLQRKYGVPWEIIFAQMQLESGMGTAGVALGAAKQGGYNWLGITGSGDLGSYQKCPECRKWAVFSSMHVMMDAYAGRKVLRNGYYDAAFAYLDPNNYNLHGFLSKMISIYAPASDGNNVTGYVSSIEGLLAGPIKQVREEMGWPSSAELAKNENIGIGGEHPIGGTVPGGGGGGGEIIENDPCLDESQGDVPVGELISGGMTLAEAQAFMQAYINRARLKETGTVIFDGARIDEPSGGTLYGTLNNCSAFSQWFSNRYTTANVGLYQGSATVSRLLSSGQGYINGGHTPKVYAIMSSSNPNHTGVVLGIDVERDKIIIGEASYHNGLNGYPRAKEYSLSQYTGSNYTYAYTDNILRGL